MQAQNKIPVTKSFLKQLTYDVIGAAIEVHRELGPGLLESFYHESMKHELNLRGIQFVSESSIPVFYKNFEVGKGFRFDLFVENCLVVELKAIDTVPPIHIARLLTYMTLLKSPQGLVINFNCINIYKEGQKTYVNKFFEGLEE